MPLHVDTGAPACCCPVKKLSGGKDGCWTGGPTCMLMHTRCCSAARRDGAQRHLPAQRRVLQAVGRALGGGFAGCQTGSPDCSTTATFSNIAQSMTALQLAVCLCTRTSNLPALSVLTQTSSCTRQELDHLQDKGVLFDFHQIFKAKQFGQNMSCAAHIRSWRGCKTGASRALARASTRGPPGGWGGTARCRSTTRTPAACGRLLSR